MKYRRRFQAMLAAIQAGHQAAADSLHASLGTHSATGCPICNETEVTA